MIDTTHKLWELVNPSDPVTFRAETLKLALFATVQLGLGQYAAREILPDGKEGLTIPFFMFGAKAAIDEYCQDNFAAPWEQVEAQVIAECLPEAIAVFRSLVYGDTGDRRLIEELLAALPSDAARLERLAEWNEEKRSSMNNIVGRATSIADALEKIKNETADEKLAAQA